MQFEIKPRGKSGTYHVRFTTPSGRRVQRSARTSNRKEAEQFAVTLYQEQSRIELTGEARRYTWLEAVVQFGREKAERKKSWRDDVTKFRDLDPLLGHLYLNQIDKAKVNEVRAWVLDTGKSAATANRYMALIRSVLRYARDQLEWVERIPKVTTTREVADRFNWLTVDQANELIDRLTARWMFHTAEAAQFALSTGLRARNIATLTWDRVDMDKRVAWVNSDDMKGGKAHGVPLAQSAMDVLIRQRGRHSSNVFTYKGEPVRCFNTRAFRRVLDDMGLRPHEKPKHPTNFRFHDLRHTWASWHVQNGTPLKVLQELGGWSSYQMVLRYAHLAPENLTEFSDQMNTAAPVDNSMIGAILVQQENGSMPAGGARLATV